MNVKLINLPQLADDAVSVNEDNTATIVSQPQHGRLSLDSDGTYYSLG